MQQLPKAEKLFSQIINKKIQGYIQKSEEVSEQYLRQHQQAIQNKVLSLKTISDVQYQIDTLNNILHSKIQIQGTSLKQIESIRDEYLKVLKKYQLENLSQKHDNQVQHKINIEDSNKDQNENICQIDSLSNLEQLNIEQNQQKNLIQKQQKRLHRKNRKNQLFKGIKLKCLKSLEVLTLSSMIGAFFFTIFK